ncbi:MAG TPA: deoxyribose-phosphate aldolase [Chloroflexota bacterium]|nr:deoxyribose-phosphate aldolase [Chloroflexota bacterium]
MNYDLRGYRFSREEFFPKAIFDRIADVRVNRPEAVRDYAARRRRRRSLTRDGKLVILASDHPGRMVTAMLGDPLGMGNRVEYLGRILRVAATVKLDGMMSTPDFIEDLMIVDMLNVEAGGPSFLDEQLLIGCVNRGGLIGAKFEMDDRITAYTPKGIAKMGLDGAKLMFRIDLADEGSGKTLEYCARTIDECNDLGLPVFLEPLPSEKVDGVYRVKRVMADNIRQMGVASALGYSSLNTWLKIQFTPDFDRVVQASSLPLLMLGGESKGNPTEMLEQFQTGMSLGGNVRGAMVGRNVTYPGPDDPAGVAAAVNAIVHEGAGLEDAYAALARMRGTQMDVLKRLML